MWHAATGFPIAELRTDTGAEQTMAMPISADTRWTVEALWALPDDTLERRELVDGVLCGTT